MLKPDTSPYVLPPWWLLGSALAILTLAPSRESFEIGVVSAASSILIIGMGTFDKAFKKLPRNFKLYVWSALPIFVSIFLMSGCHDIPSQDMFLRAALVAFLIHLAFVAFLELAQEA